MKYRIKEIKITNDFSEYQIQRRILFMWFIVNVDYRYTCSLTESQKWVKLKTGGYPVTKYYYE